MIRIKNFINRIISKWNLFKVKKMFKRKGASLGEGLICYGKPVIVLQKKNSLILGENIKINSDVKVNPIGYSASPCSFFTVGNGTITIGNNVGVSNVALVAHSAKLVIEDYVMLGGGVKIYTSNFHSLNFENRILPNDPDIQCADVTIKKGAFLGAGVIVLKGVTIGEKSIVGAGSVVTKSIPDGEVWGGNPAKFIKKLTF